jgi:release factor glutamine methyltransferase
VSGEVRSGRELVSWLRNASRVARGSRRVTRHLFGARVAEGVHEDLWDATTLTLRKALGEFVHDGDRVLELGTGHIGVLSIYAAKLRRVDIVAVDISERFVDNARRVAEASGASRVAFLQSNWFSNVAGEFDLVFCNLPYVPTASGGGAGATTDHRQIWDGGEDGLVHAVTILEQAPRFVSQRGRLLLGVNTMYVPPERTKATIEKASAFRLERVVRSRISPSEVYVCAPLAPLAARANQE